MFDFKGIDVVLKVGLVSTALVALAVVGGGIYLAKQAFDSASAANEDRKLGAALRQDYCKKEPSQRPPSMPEISCQ
jgi:hypothetical protein